MFLYFSDRVRSVTNLIYQSMCGVVVHELCATTLDPIDEHEQDICIDIVAEQTETNEERTQIHSVV